MAKKLSAKRHAFVVAYVTTAAFNAAEAARIAGYAQPHMAGSRLLAIDEIAHAVQKHANKVTARATMTAIDVVEWLEDVLRGNVSGDPETDLAGEFVGSMPPKLSDRLKAADMLMKYHRAYEKPVELPALESTGVEVIEVRGPEDAKRQLAALRAEEK